MTPAPIGRVRSIFWIGLFLSGVTAGLGACALLQVQPVEVRPIAVADLKSGIDFSSRELREQQDDPILNPGMLWVDQGQRAWKAPPGNGQPSCESCHGDAKDSMKGLAARLPRASADGKRLHNLHTLANRCRVDRQQLAALDYESQSLLGLVSYLAYQSRGLSIDVDVGGAAKPFFEQGRNAYQERIGQINLACTHCHDQNWGRRLLNEPISQGHGNAYPIYRLEWQTAGSLHRRFRSCQFGVRAELFPQGHETFMALELYLAWRGQGLLIESPGVRR